MAKPTRPGKTQKRSRVGLSPLRLLQEMEHLGAELSSHQEPIAVMHALSARLVGRYGVAVSGIWVMNDAESALELAAVAGKPNLPHGLRKAPLTQTILGKAVQRRLPQMLTPNESVPDELVDWAQQHRLRFLAAYPLGHDSKVQGVLLVACVKSPTKGLLALFRVHAKLAALALRDAELLSSTQRALNKLSFLVEASKVLSSTLDLSEVLARILEVAESQVEAERGTIFLVDENAGEIWSLIAHGLEKQEIRLPLGKGIAGHVAKTGDIVNIPDAYADPRFNPEVDKRTGFRTRNILCLPIRNKAGKIIAALQLLNKVHGAFTDEDADFLLTLSGHMALALENAQLHQQLLEKERLEKELALGREIQRSLLPESTPVVEGFDIALLNAPCYEVGGDYYDFLTPGPETLLVVIADVEGKGVSSALVMSNLQATLRALVLHLISLSDLAEALNRNILAQTRSRKSLSLFMALINVRQKELDYINCGHVPPVIVRLNHAAIPLTEGGMIVGLFGNATYDRGHEKLQPGDVLILCTDGITESMNAEQEEYGSDRLTQCVREVADRPATEIVAAVSADVARFSRQGTHIDDKVMIVVKVREFSC